MRRPVLVFANNFEIDETYNAMSILPSSIIQHSTAIMF